MPFDHASKDTTEKARPGRSGVWPALDRTLSSGAVRLVDEKKPGRLSATGLLRRLGFDPRGLFGESPQDRALGGQERALTSAQLLRHPSKGAGDPEITLRLHADRSPQEESDPFFHVHHLPLHAPSGRNPSTLSPPTRLPTAYPDVRFHVLPIRRRTFEFRCSRYLLHPLHPGPLTGRPGRAPVCTPSLTTATPFTQTCSTPVES